MLKWIILTPANLIVACFAEVIAKQLQDRGIFTPQEADEVIERALKHDTNKRIEVFRKKAARAGMQDSIPSLMPGRMVDKIVHLADDMSSTSIPLPGERPYTTYLIPWERIIASEFPSRYPDLWQDGLGFDPQGRIIELKDIIAADRNLRWVRSYAFWQPFISNKICRELQGIIDPESAQKPEYFVKDLVNNSLLGK